MHLTRRRHVAGPYRRGSRGPLDGRSGENRSGVGAPVPERERASAPDALTSDTTHTAEGPEEGTPGMSDFGYDTDGDGDVDTAVVGEGPFQA